MLNLADFRAGEKALQIMAEIANLADYCLIQTNQPEHPVIRALENNNYQYFYQQELRNRQELEFPPFSEFIKFIYKHINQKIAQKEATQLYQQLQRVNNQKFRVYPPHFSLPKKIRNKYNIFINLKIADQKLKTKLKKIIPSDWQVDVQPKTLL
jgi:primosomal protein N' (replication factor Y)